MIITKGLVGKLNKYQSLKRIHLKAEGNVEISHQTLNQHRQNQIVKGITDELNRIMLKTDPALVKEIPTVKLDAISLRPKCRTILNIIT